MGMFITKLWTEPQEFFLIVLVVVFSICLHEFCHAYAALLLGDSTAADRGHLTLNPLKQMGFMSIVMFLFIGIAWGGVPVNPYNLTKRGRILTALAGPLMNFVLFVLAILIYPLLALFTPAPPLLISYVFVAGVYNLILFIFNMLPVPGLDGWNILSQFIDLKKTGSEIFKGAMVLLIFGMLMLYPYITKFAGRVMELPLLLLGGGK